MSSESRQTDLSDDEKSPHWLAVVGRGALAGAQSVGRSVARAYQSIDPDLRRHAYQLPVAGLSLLAPRPGAVEPLPDDGYRPVIMVHGLGGHPGNFFGVQKSFARRGRTRCYVVDFGSARSFEVMEAHLRSVIDDIFALNELDDHAEVDIVAHSMGGLISRLVADDPEARTRIANIVTLGTPHTGSHLARLAATELTLGLRPGSEVMHRLDAQDFWDEPDAPLITAVWSDSDTVVIPATNAMFEHARNIELEDATHYSYLMRPTAWKLIWDLLLR